MTREKQSNQPRAFFGRRKGHRLKPARAALFETLLPGLALDLAAPPEPLCSLFSNPVDEVRLEIGFGGGEHLLGEAQAQARIGFIGIEPFVNGMAKALAAIAARSLSNIRLHHGDAIEVLAWLPPASLARVDLLYPDPWPKRRHWKRRFVQDSHSRRDRTRPAPGRRVSRRYRHCGLRRLDAQAHAPMSQFRMDRRARG